MKSEHALRIEGLDLYYGEARALSQVSLEIGAGQIVALVGANGAGKSSLIRSIAGMERPRAGQIQFGSTRITGWDSHRVCELGIAHVAEGRQVFPSLSVLDGWWLEGHVEGVTGWAIGGRPRDGGTPDGERDADDLYEQLERVILPMFYQRPDDYVDVMRQTIGLTGSFFNTHRMLQQYLTRAYFL